MSEKVYVNICDTKKCPGPVYAVKTGDTLYSIAQRHHCRVRTLLDLNPFVDIYNLQPGEEICVPDCRGQGKVDFRAVFTKLHELGYNSYVTIEREIDGPQQLTDILESRTYLQNIIDEIYGEEASC
mgnify:CR=1 FL=1